MPFDWPNGSYRALVLLHHQHNNPVMHCVLQLLAEGAAERRVMRERETVDVVAEASAEEVAAEERDDVDEESVVTPVDGKQAVARAATTLEARRALWVHSGGVRRRWQKAKFLLRNPLVATFKVVDEPVTAGTNEAI